MGDPYAQFRYDAALPIVINQLQKRFFLYPTGTYQQQVSQNDIIRFQFPKTADFFDPWSVYLNFTVNVNPAQLANADPFYYKCLQLAGSGHSFIQRQVIYDPTGRELERFNGYNLLMDCLADINFDPQV